MFFVPLSLQLFIFSGLMFTFQYNYFKVKNIGNIHSDFFFRPLDAKLPLSYKELSPVSFLAFSKSCQVTKTVVLRRSLFGSN